MKFIYGKQDFRSLERAQENCFLLTNGLGGYASLSAAFSVTRCDQGVLIGAQSARFAMEDAFIRKELRNNANRATNCDSANMERAVIAASRQAQAIELLLKTIGEQSLPPALLETAKLRLANPEVSLEELGRLCDPPIGKSGVNHRLRKLEKMAREIMGETE